MRIKSNNNNLYLLTFNVSVNIFIMTEIRTVQLDTVNNYEILYYLFLYIRFPFLCVVIIIVEHFHFVQSAFQRLTPELVNPDFASRLLIFVEGPTYVKLYKRSSFRFVFNPIFHRIVFFQALNDTLVTPTDQHVQMKHGTTSPVHDFCCMSKR